MSEIEVRLMEPEEWELAAPMILPFWRKLVREEASVFGAWCGEELCGALGVLSEENMLVLLSVYVKKEWRGQGIASMMMNRVEEMGRISGMSLVSVVYTCTDEEAWGVCDLLLERGFQTPQPGEQVFACDLESVAQSYLARLPEAPETALGHIVNWQDALPLVLEDHMQDRVSEMLAEMQRLEEADELCSDLCLAYVDQGKVQTMVMVTLEDELLYLRDGFLDDPRYGMAMVFVLKEMLKLVKVHYPKCRLLVQSAASEKKNSAISRLFDGADVKKYTTWRAIKWLEEDFPLPDDYYETMVRCSSLTRALQERGIGSGMIMTGGEPASLWLDVEGTEERVELYYTPQREEEDEETFLLDAVLLLPAEELSEEQKQELCSRINEEEGPGEAFFYEENPDILVFSDQFTEDAEFREEVLDDFLMPYLKHAERCAALAKEYIH